MGSSSSTMKSQLISPRAMDAPPRPTPPSSLSIASSHPESLDLASLRNAALQSANRASSFVADEDSRNGSISTAFAKVEIKRDEKEEGEISESEEDEVQYVEQEARTRSKSPSPVRPSRIGARPPRGPRRISGIPLGPSASGSPSMRIDSLKPEDKVFVPARSSPGPVASAPPDISPGEAQQYMDIIRNLLHEGFSPDALIRRGATAKYVTAVCEDIVSGTKRRKALWLQARDSNDARMDSSEVEVLVTMTREQSNSSENSAEIRLIERLSPPKNRPARLVASSHWTPTPGGPSGGPSQAVPIDSFKPGQTIGRTGVAPSHPRSLALSSESSVPQAASHVIVPSPASNCTPQGASFSSSTNQYSPSQRATVLSSLPAKPTDYVITAANGHDGRRLTSHETTITPEPPEIFDEDEEQATPKRSTVRQSLFPVASFAIPPSLPSPSPVVAESPTTVTTSSTLIALDVELAAKNAILETRRKALESMKFRRAAAKTVSSAMSSTFMEFDPDNSNFSSSFLAPQPTAAERTIEQEVADLEKEVLDLQSSADAMDVDGPEEGEITLSTIPVWIPPVSSSSIPISASLPIMRAARGIKRPNAEDLDNRPTSLPSRSVPPSKRRLFGGVAQRLNRLVISLDDDSNSDSDDEKANLDSADDVETQRLLAEKEEGIRILKEKIAARLRAKEKRITLAEREHASSHEGSPMQSEGMAIDIAQSVHEAAAEMTYLQAYPSSGADPPVPGTHAAMDIDRMAIHEVQSAAEHVTAVQDVKAMKEELSREARLHRSESATPIPAEASDLSIRLQGTPNPSPFSAYQPLLRRYPQLVTHSNLSSALPHISLALHSSARSDPFGSIDKSLLSSVMLTNRLEREPNAMMCEAEAGGGKCADPSCQYVHLDKGLEPSYEDLVDYVLQVSPNALDRPTAMIALETAGKELDLPTMTASPTKGKKGKKKALSGRTWTVTDESLVALMRRVCHIIGVQAL